MTVFFCIQIKALIRLLLFANGRKVKLQYSSLKPSDGATYSIVWCAPLWNRSHNSDVDSSGRITELSLLSKRSWTKTHEGRRYFPRVCLWTNLWKSC